MTKDSKQSPVENDHCPKYFKGDKVYAADSGETYQAIIRCSAFRSLEGTTFWEYHVHFQGWSVRHDRWLQEDSIRPDSDEEARRLANISIQKGLEQKERRAKITQTERDRKEKKHLKAKEDKLGSTSPAKKRKQSVLESITKVLTMAEYCTLPFTLQIILVNDSRKVTRIGRYVTQGYDPISHENWAPPRLVHNIPATTSVNDILTTFVKNVNHLEDDLNMARNEEARRIEYHKFSADMASLFNIMLPKYLLFKQERAQYLSLMQQGESQNDLGCMSNVYGGEFLLRMLIRLPLIFSSITSVSSESLSERSNISSESTYPLLEQWRTGYQKHHSLGRHIAKLIVYLQGRPKLFKGDYRKPSPIEWTNDERAFAETCAKPTSIG